MSYHVRMSGMMLQVPPADDRYFRSAAPADSDEPTVAPVTALDTLLAWLATIGILLLLVGTVVVASLVWFVNLFFAAPAPDEGVGE
jgi:hypothetical protein